LLKAPDPRDHEEVQRDLLIKAHILEDRLKGFGVEGKVTGIHHGPVITRYEFELAPGIRVTRIVNLADDLALCLKASSLRVVAPVPGESVVGIEVPNEIRQIVYLREIIGSAEFRKQRSRLTLALGKDTKGRPFIADLTWMPHLLIAGATGSGKSVCLNAILCSLLFKATAEEVKFIFIDPKRLELGIYAGLPHLLRPIVTEPGEALEILNWVILEMERRYKLLAPWGVRNLAQYNALLQRNAKREEKPLPYIVIMVDELADLMLVSSRRVEKPIVRIAQMARAVGIHMVVATQRPSVNVITGLIKANFPARIAFRTASQIDSRTILDSKGAESLIGNGDMLFLTPGTTRPERIHGAFVSEEEIHNLIGYLKKQKGLKLFKG
jgi:S-DNA-T family DNA segregation ATPase FtsK/SpoIIIE